MVSVVDNLNPQLFSLKLHETPPMIVNITNQMWILEDDNGNAQPMPQKNSGHVLFEQVTSCGFQNS